MSKVTVRDLAACAGCRICMTICSFTHEERNECRPSRSRITVNRSTITGETSIIFRDDCDQCFNCVRWCPASVLKAKRED